VPEILAMPEKFNYGIDKLTIGNAIALASWKAKRFNKH
jgi:hypothetical protein